MSAACVIATLAFMTAMVLASPPAAAAERPIPTHGELVGLDSVQTALRHKDCASVVQRLNAGLKAEYPSFFILAGVLYEEGLCLKPNWERAERMYLQAQAAGHEGGLLRLVSGLAVKGRDPAAALWWAQRADSLPLPADCMVHGPVREDADLFVATLRLWEPGRLAGCVYSAGVVATIAGDLEYPALAQDLSIVGEVSMVFEPASSSLQWQTVEVQALQMLGLVRRDMVNAQLSREARQSLENHLRQQGQLALARYERPAGIPAGWRIEMRFLFNQR